jgi:hypothetical protein
MFIYIDETFQLKRGSRGQFMAVAGFAVINPVDCAKAYKRLKKKCLPKGSSLGEIKSTNSFSELYIIPALLSEKHMVEDIQIGIVSQQKSNLNYQYYRHGELNYDMLYLELVKHLLLNCWDYIDRDVTIITLDTFSTKTINKADIAGAIQAELKLQNEGVNFNVRFGDSISENNLQLADQICGIVYKSRVHNKDFKENLENKYSVKEIIDPFKI